MEEKNGAAKGGYEEQLIQWRTLFSEEGFCIVNRHGRYPVIQKELVKIPYFYQNYYLDLKTGVLFEEDQKECSLSAMSQMMIYSHLYHLKKDAAASGEFTSYDEIKGNRQISGWGMRTNKDCGQLASICDKDCEKVKRIVKELGGRIEDKGDLSFTLEAFSDVRFFYLYWKGEEEFPSQIRILYEKNLSDFVHMESAIILANTGANYISELYQALEDNSHGAVRKACL